MREGTRIMRLERATAPRIVDARGCCWPCLSCCLSGVDRISFFDSYTSFGIAPWNPGTGLSFVLILVFGRQVIPLPFVAPLLADVNQSTSSLCWKTEEGSRSRLYSRRKPGPEYHADLNKFVVNRFRISASRCRSIVEAHGGRLWLDAVSRGAFGTLHITDSKEVRA